MAEKVKGTYFLPFRKGREKTKIPSFSPPLSSPRAKNNETVQPIKFSCCHETRFEHTFSFGPVVMNEKMGFDEA